MPRVMGECEELAMKLGEAIADDVDCWESESEGRRGILRITLNGSDFTVTVKKDKPPANALEFMRTTARNREKARRYEPEPDE